MIEFYRMINIISYLSLGLISLSLPLHGAPLTLEGAYRAALKRSESLTSQEKQVLLADERYKQVRAGVLPQLVAQGSYLIQDEPSDPLAKSFFPQTQPEAKLTLRQPIFRGLREFAALGQLSSLKRAEKHAWDWAANLLYKDMAQSYHGVLAAEQDLKNLQDQLQIYDERISELRGRVRAGTSNITDQLTLQSSRASVRSQTDLAGGSLTAQRERFAFLTGLPMNTELAPVTSKPPKPDSIERLLEKLEERPDFLDAKEKVRAADSTISLSKGAHFPTIDVEANYYFKRPAINDGMDWDVMAVLKIPIFTGGETTSQVRSANLEKERTELEVNRLKRQAEQEVRTLHSNYVAALSSIEALTEGLEISEKNYQLLKRDYTRGLARILDVQQALTASLEIRRSLANAGFAAHNTWIELQIASGKSLGKPREN